MKWFEYQFPPECLELADWQVSGTEQDPRLFRERSEIDFATVQPFIGQPRTVLDVGCGLGRMSVFLNAQLEDPGIRFILADTTRISRSEGPIAGWNPGDDFYNDLALTARFAEMNGLRNVETFDLLRDDWARLPKVDLIMSFLAVGFHFPIENTMPKLLAVASGECTMIFGVRKGRYGQRSFRSRFRSVRLLEPLRRASFTAKQDYLVLEELRGHGEEPGRLERAGWALRRACSQASYGSRRVARRALASVGVTQTRENS
jgi:hypothetical protein